MLSLSPRLFFAAAPFLATIWSATASAPRHTPSQPKPLATGTIDLEASRVFFPATVHGKTTNLILDLGTTGNLISRDEAVRLGIPDASSASEVELDSMTVGSSVRHKISFEVTESEFGGAPILMGAPFQSYYDLVFDGPAHRATLYARTDTTDTHPKQARWYPGSMTPADCLPMTGDADGYQRVFFELKVNGHPVHSMFDSGTNTTNMNAYGAREADLTLAKGNVHPIIKNEFLGQYQALWQGGPAVMTVNGRPLAEDSVTIFRHIPREKQGPGIKDGELSLGLSAIRDRVMLVSYSANQMCLGAPAAAPATATPPASK